MTGVATTTAPFGRALVRLGAERDDVIVLSADLAHWTDVVPFADAYPERFLNVGMAEQNMVGIAAGIAHAGLYPVIVTYGVFVTRRAYDQVAMGLCTGGVSALLVGFLPGITSQFKATHQAIDDVALMRVLPGMTVLDPADAGELSAMTLAAPNLGGPVYLRAMRGSVAELFGPDVDVMRARLVTTGSRGAFITSGLATQWAMEIDDTDVLHVPCLKPVDAEGIAEYCRDRAVVHCVENHSTVGGLFDIVSSVIAARGLGTRVVAHGVPDRWAEYGSIDHNRATLGLDAATLAAAMRS